MLEKVTNIEGLDAFQDHQLADDTRPGDVQVTFFTKAEEMPALTAAEGRIVRKTFVYVKREWELGRSINIRRIRDTVEFNDETGKWVVKKLAADKRSDIRRNPDEWNAFYRGTSVDDLGTPLSLLFAHDPSRVAMYEERHIRTIERLLKLNDTDAAALGAGVSDDVARGKRYMAQAKELAAGTAAVRALEERDHTIASLQAQVADLAQKLTAVLEDKITSKKKGARANTEELNAEA